jgi:hypothetical protein
VIYSQCNKLGHSKEHCHWNLDNLNNKFKDKNEVAMNGVLAQIGGNIRNKFGNKGGHGEANKSSTIIYHYFFCSYVEHKVDDYLHKNVVQAMSRETTMVATPKKKYVVNMVLAITTYKR